jgi:hypothetical protein
MLFTKIWLTGAIICAAMAVLDNAVGITNGSKLGDRYAMTGGLLFLSLAVTAVGGLVYSIWAWDLTWLAR